MRFFRRQKIVCSTSFNTILQVIGGRFVKSIKNRVEELEIQIHNLEYRMDSCYQKIDEQNKIIVGLQSKLQGNKTIGELAKTVTELDSVENAPNLFKEKMLEKPKIEISDTQGSEMLIHGEKIEIEKQDSSISKAELLKKKLPIATASGKKTPRFEMSDVKLPKKSKTNDGKPRGEAMVGKYIIGALSALLLFVATGSFVAMIWNKMTSETKVGLIFLVGILLSGASLKFILKDKNPIYAILLGTGAGVIYIDILSANLAFHLVGNNITLVLCLIWAMLFIFLSNKIQMFFTVIIAYIGSIITLLLGLSLAHTGVDRTLLFAFMVLVCTSIVGNSLKMNRKYSVITLNMSFVSFIILFFEYYPQFQMLSSLCIVVFGVILFALYKVLSSEKELFYMTILIYMLSFIVLLISITESGSDIDNLILLTFISFICVGMGVVSNKIGKKHLVVSLNLSFAMYVFSFLDNLSSFNWLALVCMVAFSAICFLLYKALSDKKELIVTTVVTYVSILIVVIFSIFIVETDFDRVLLFAFITLACVSMVANAYKVNKEFLTTALNLSFLLYIGVFSLNVSQCKWLALLAVIGLFAIDNILYREEENSEKNPEKIPISMINTAVAFITLYQLLISEIAEKAVLIYLTIFVVAFMQYLAINLLWKNIRKPYDVFFSLVIGLALLGINKTLFNDNISGLIILCVILYIVGKVIHKEVNYLLIVVILLIDNIVPILLHMSTNLYADSFIKSNVMNYVYGTLNIVAFVYLLFDIYKTKLYSDLTVFKIIGFPLCLTSILLINFNVTSGATVESSVLYNSITYAVIVLFMLGFVTIGYFKNWEDENFKMTDHGGVLDDFTLSSIFYVATAILYFVGIRNINFVNGTVPLYVYCTFTIAIAVVQSKEILKRDVIPYVTHVLLGLKYLVLTFSILNGLLNVEIVSFLYNIAGLVVAVISIALGFKWAMKGLRDYGLCLTILVVLKFIVVDMRGENSIKRVLSMIVGAILCFAISFIYNKLSVKFRDKNSENE